MSSKAYKEELADLEAGLKSISNSKYSYTRIINAKQIQEARIQFFKIGYNLHKREIQAQQMILEKYKSKGVKA